jgi:hypothetical protein
LTIEVVDLATDSDEEVDTPEPFELASDTDEDFLFLFMGLLLFW